MSAQKHKELKFVHSIEKEKEKEPIIKKIENVGIQN
jgi:hypothetical protein